MLKCYKCTVSEESYVIVFAHNASEAKEAAMHDDQIHCEAWDTGNDAGRPPKWFIKVRREKTGDQFAVGESPYLLPFFTDENIHIWRHIGFFEIDKDTCDTCGCSDYDKEEYRICWGCNTCKECAGKELCITCFLCPECGHNAPESEDYADWMPLCKKRKQGR